MIGDSYATTAELAYRLDRADDGTFTALLDSASRTVELFCRRQFNKTTSATARRFRATDGERLPVDDFHTLTGLIVSVNSIVWANTYIDPRPWNGTVDGQTGWPFFDLFAIGRTWTFERRPTVSVTAQWGWTAVPAGVKQATLEVAATMSYGSAGSSLPVASEAIDTYRVSYFMPGAWNAGTPAELRTVDRYRRKLFGVA